MELDPKRLGKVDEKVHEAARVIEEYCASLHQIRVLRLALQDIRDALRELRTESQSDYSDTNTDLHHAKMERAFALVKPAGDWRAPIDTFVSYSAQEAARVNMDDICEAITYFTATTAQVMKAGSGWRVRAIGYRAGPAGP